MARGRGSGGEREKVGEGGRWERGSIGKRGFVVNKSKTKRIASALQTSDFIFQQKKDRIQSDMPPKVCLTFGGISLTRGILYIKSGAYEKRSADRLKVKIRLCRTPKRLTRMLAGGCSVERRQTFRYKAL